MLAPDDAEKLIRETITRFLREDCPLLEAQGRVLREEIRADRDLPPFDRVTMDGYALRSSSVSAGVKRFKIEGTQAAGMRAFALSEAEDACIEIMTGAVLPEGADCVVPFEDTQREGETMTLTGSAAPSAGSAIHQRGSDHRQGEVIVPIGMRITGREIAVAAAVGGATLTVSAVPRIAVIATGDELVEVGAGVAPHQIRRSNDYAIRAALIAAGYDRVDRYHLRDVRHEIEQRLSEILTRHDVVLLMGGVSKGKFDYLPASLEALGVKKIFHGVAQRPGKPFWFGRSTRNTPVFALPGNPVSAYTCLHRYVLPALRHASGLPPAPPRKVALSEAVSFKAPLAYLLPVRLSSGSHAELLATPHPANTSGDFAGLVATDGFVELPAEQSAFAAGYVTRFWPWT